MNKVTHAPEVAQKSALAVYAEQYKVESKLWEEIKQDKTTAESGDVVEVALSMAKDVLRKYCPTYYVAFDKAFNPNGEEYQPYSIILMCHSPKFTSRKSKKRTKTVLGWLYSFMSEVGLVEQLVSFEKAVSSQLPK